MKIVDKYELAKCSYGTPFYLLKDIEARKLTDEGEWQTIFPIQYEINSGLQILTSRTFYTSNGEPMFNGVCPVQPDNLFLEAEGYGDFTEDNVTKIKFELFEIDDDSNNYDDEDRFLVLNKNEFKLLLDQLTEYYNKLVD